MYELTLQKPDGRSLTLYGREPLEPVIPPLLVRGGGDSAGPQRRWHPLRGEWVAYAVNRQQRTFLPPPEYNPLLPADAVGMPTELPRGNYDVAVFDNMFPALDARATVPLPQIVGTAPGTGQCEVVVFTQDPHGSLGGLPLAHLELLLEVWARRVHTLAQRRDIRYVLPFENRGAEVGVTLHHPHGQIYAYPFVPPVPARMHGREREFYLARQKPLLESLIESELAENRRMLYVGEHAVAFVPAWARYPYEVWVAPRLGTADFRDLTAAQRQDLALALKTVLLKYDGLWQMPFPYIMAWYQAPLDADTPRAHHLHAEFFPAYRMKGRLKYLAGTEVAAGLFVNDTLPEEKAAELQAVAVDVHA